MTESANLLWIAPNFVIPHSEIELTFSRSSGPGGQNVNKVNTKARLRWNPRGSRAVPPFLVESLMARLGPRLTTEGDLILVSDRFRDQLRNREDCLEKLQRLLMEAIIPRRKRKATKPTRSSRRKTLEKKKHHSDKKSGRQKVRY